MRDVSTVSFDFLVAAAQILLAAALLARRRRPEWAWPMAGILAANAGQALVDAATVPFEAGWSSWTFQGLDLVIFLCFVHLALAFPDRPRSLRRPWALPAILLLLAGGIVGLHAWLGDEIVRPRFHLSGVPQLLVGYAFPAAAWTLLLGRWAWRWRAMAAAHRGTFQWLFAAFALRAANILVVTLPVDGLVEQARGLVLWARLLNWVPLLALLAVLLTLAFAFVRETGVARRQTTFVIGFLMAGFLEAMAAFSTGGAADFWTDMIMHLDILIVRPILVWCAISLHDEETAWTTRWPGLAAVGMLVSAVFSKGLTPGVQGALPGWPGVAVSFALAAALAAAAVLLARAWLASRPAVADGPGNPWVPGQQVFGRYRIEGLLGEGSTGAAYLAHDRRTGQPVVLKRTRSLAREQRQALTAEASAVAGLDHPNVVRLLRVEQDGEDPVLVLEHLAGGSLRARISAGLGEAEAVRVAVDVLSALEAAHANGILHRDIKPENILLDASGRAKLGDFGSAEVGRPDARLGDPTLAAQRSTGSLRYMAPEQVRGKTLDGRTDLYAMAVVLYETLAARHPLPEGSSDLQIRNQIAEGPPPRMAPVPQRLRAVVARGLQKAPSRRFQSPAEFRRALERLDAPGAQVALKTSTDRPTPSRSPDTRGRHSPGARRSQLTNVPLRDSKSRTA